MLLVAHGSRDPRSARTVRTLADRVAARWPGPVGPAFLDFDAPSVAESLRKHRHSSPVVVPLLLTSAYHHRVDLPAVLHDTGVAAEVAEVLGPATPEEAADLRLLGALSRRLSELDLQPGFDGIVLIAAGTSDASARSTVDRVAQQLSTVHHVPCAVGYASASGPTPQEAVAGLRSAGATRVAGAAYFLAAGRLYDAAAASALTGGSVGVAAPLGAATELVELILDRARTASRVRPITAAA
ncbi:MAG TPA: CbiX/SirB N-terminal domain-containing protein [Micromonosporaceae bacterium]|nr:CbiX/SirB N-terminal domain-containing protein [Micromonosporaceae bacterium]